MALLALTFLLVRPLLLLTRRWFGHGWTPLVLVAIECVTLWAIGWLIGRLHRSAPLFAVLAFAVTLTLCDLEPWLTINVPWLLRLAWDALHSAAYLPSLASTAGEDALLFASLFAGAMLTRPSVRPTSFFGGSVR
jgi:hypothetical protein